MEGLAALPIWVEAMDYPSSRNGEGCGLIADGQTRLQLSHWEIRLGLVTLDWNRPKIVFT
jgi:hypothetical protein